MRPIGTEQCLTLLPTAMKFFYLWCRQRLQKYFFRQNKVIFFSTFLSAFGDGNLKFLALSATALKILNTFADNASNFFALLPTAIKKISFKTKQKRLFNRMKNKNCSKFIIFRWRKTDEWRRSQYLFMKLLYSDSVYGIPPSLLSEIISEIHLLYDSPHL